MLMNSICGGRSNTHGDEVTKDCAHRRAVEPNRKQELMLGLQIFLLLIQCFNSNQHVWIASAI